MATRRWTADRSSILALKNGEVNLGAGHDDHLTVGYNTFEGNTYRNRSAVRFALTWADVGQIVSATLSVKTTSGIHFEFGADPDIYVRRITSSWNTNNDRSGFDSPAGGGFTGDPADFGTVSFTSVSQAGPWDVTTVANTWDSVDITDIVEAWAPASVKKRSGAPGDGLANYGIVLRAVDEALSSDRIEFFGVGLNSASVKPTILLTYTAAGSPPTATITAPTGTVASQTPTIAGTYSDADGDAMAKLDIQVSTTTTFASTLWNLSQTTVFTHPTSATWQKVYAGSALAAGQTYYVRARVYDSAGNASAWTAAQSFTIYQQPGGTGIVVPKPPAFRAFPARIELYAHTTGFGPGQLRAIIDDAKYIGVSEYANDVGEAYWTMPYNHPLIAEVQPLLRHYRVSRYDAVAGAYRTIGRGILDDFDVDQDEAVIHGSNYMSLPETSITASSTTYTTSLLGAIVLAELSAAIGETSSRLAFTSATSGSGAGFIENTSTTATLMTAFQQRLQFIQQVAQVAMAESSVRTIFSMFNSTSTPRDAPYTWSFRENQGSEELTNLRLEYGGNINGFRYIPGFDQYANQINAIGVRREGASVLYSTQSAGSIGTYGRMSLARLFQDVTDQTSLDKLALRAARVAANPDKQIAIILRASQIVPWDGWDIADTMRLLINRGSLVNLNTLATLWSMEWTVSPIGGENLYLGLASKLT